MTAVSRACSFPRPAVSRARARGYAPGMALKEYRANDQPDSVLSGRTLDELS